MIAIEDYTKRIQYQGDLEPTMEVLQNLQRQHLLHVPFENLSIHYKRPITLNLEKVYNKVIHQNRGGFCYELNGLFYAFLRQIGFDARRISARVYDSDKDVIGEEYDHLCTMVTLDQKEYLVDVGFGEFTFAPLLLELNLIQQDPRGEFVIEQFDDIYLKVSKINEGQKKIEYIFTTEKREYHEFSGMCHYHQTHPESHFTQKKMITKPLENGRVTLTADTLKLTKGGEVEGITITADNFGHYLKEWFGINEHEL